MVVKLAAGLVWSLVIFASAMIAQSFTVAVAQSVLWLPTGFALACVWRLGARSAWAVALGVFLHRSWMEMPPTLALVACAGTTAEALLGAWVLRQLRFDASFTRLRDALALFAAAAVGPLASLLLSIVGRELDPLLISRPFYSGWLGWWRMNALGALTVTPFLLVWWNPARARLSVRARGEAVALAALAALLVLGVMTFQEPGIEAVLALYTLLPIALVAGLRSGPQGAITVSVFGAVLVLALGSLFGGPFLDIPWLERHAPLQIFGLSLMSIPLVIGSLVAEREARVNASERQLALQAGILERVARGETTQQVLLALAHGIEELLDTSRCSILLLEGDRLRHACAPSLPQAYNAAIDGVRIGPAVGSCGTAAFTKKPVVVEDIQRDPLWTDFRALAARYDLRSCWSWPVCAASGAVLGTFAIYYEVPCRPSAQELALVERAAALCAIAIEREQREEQLRHAQRMEAVGRLAGGVAHDFNNLLTVVVGFAETLRPGLPLGSPAHENIDEILAAARRGASLTRQLLSFSRQQVVAVQVHDLGEVVEKFAGLLRRLIGEDVRLVLEHRGPPAFVRADRGQLEQVLMNLALNARDAMPLGGVLTISTACSATVESDGLAVTLAVRDTGVGMSEEVRRRAFDPFFTTKESGKGTGIGLATVYGIVQQAGGRVWIESQPERGTTVWIRMLRAEAQEIHESGVLVPHPPLGSATILLAEDEASVRELVRSALARAGYRVFAAENGSVALELARTHRGPLDLLVTDVVMPVLGGPELARELRKTRPELPVLYITGYSNEARLPLEGRGAVASLAKPFDSAHLLASVAGLLAREPSRALTAPQR